MLSRVADAVFWMSRYFERAENVARFADVNQTLALDLPEATEQWKPVLDTTGDWQLFHERYGEPTRESALKFLLFDREAPNSILSCMLRARDNARSVREVISSEMWEQVNRTYLMVLDAQSSGSALDVPHDFFTAVKQASQLFVGMTYLTMTHNEAWHFGRLGRLVERADKTSRIVDVKYFLLLPDPSFVGSAFDEIQWGALLKSTSAFEMYRKRHGHITPANVVDFLLLTPRFPRAVRYCLRKAERSLHAITGTPVGTAGTPAERELGRLASEVEYAVVAEILKSGLHEWVDTLQTRLIRVGNAIETSFFGHGPPEPEPAPQQHDAAATRAQAQGTAWQTQTLGGMTQSQGSKSDAPPPPDSQRE